MQMPIRNTKALAGVRESGLSPLPPQMEFIGKLQESPFLLRVFLIHKTYRFGLNRKRNMYVIFRTWTGEWFTGFKRCLVAQPQKILYTLEQNLKQMTYGEAPS